MNNKKEGICVSVETLFQENKKDLKLKHITKNEHFQKQITQKELHRPGLALAGFVDLFSYERVQICGNTEFSYLLGLPKGKLEQSLKKVFAFSIPCIIVTDNNRPPIEFIDMADEMGISIFVTPFATTRVFRLLGDYLEVKFAPRTIIHGSLVDVYGIGIIITGRSGIGKSEVALDLVARGHRFIADDIVTVIRHAGGNLIGMSNETLCHNMEIRGVGIIDIQAVFGIRGVRRQKRVEIQVELLDWDDEEKYERLGLEEMNAEILKEKIPLVQLPIYPGKNISVIVEVIALNQLLKLGGCYPAKNIEKIITQKMKKKLRHKGDYFSYNLE